MNDQWQVKATNTDGSVMTFGVRADSKDEAVIIATERLPETFSRAEVAITIILPRGERPKVTGE